MVPSSSELISAVSHPTRRQILRAFVAEPRRCASTNELAAALEQPVAQVGYHLKALSDCEVLRLSQGGDRGSAAVPDGWSLAVEPEWLGLVLDVWLESRAAR
jgi:DNA-binding transcriptional ArsR family regulator